MTATDSHRLSQSSQAPIWSESAYRTWAIVALIPTAWVFAPGSGATPATAPFAISPIEEDAGDDEDREEGDEVVKADDRWFAPPAPLRVAHPLPAAPRPQSPRRILVVGDSHTAGTFGRSLDLLLRTITEDVHTVGSCGLSPDGFLQSKPTRCGLLELDAAKSVTFRRRTQSTPGIDELLALHRPDLTLIELGANQINTAIKDPKGAARDIGTLASRVVDSGSACVWIGPPYGAPSAKPVDRLDNIYDVIRRSLPPECVLIDSRPKALPFLDYERLAKDARRRGDGKHFDTMGVHGQQAARRWAMSVFDQVRRLVAEGGSGSASSHRVALADRR